jgi:aminopeptidase N
MAYARTGYTVFSEGGRSAPDYPEGAAARHAGHEVAHAWWMLASPITDDFWLVESVAEYCAIRYLETALGAEAAAEMIEEKRRVSAEAGPVMGHGRPDRVQLYQKGPLLLVDLERRIGRPAMDRLLAEMAREPVHTTEIFLKRLARTAGEEAARAFEEALHS